MSENEAERRKQAAKRRAKTNLPSWRPRGHHSKAVQAGVALPLAPSQLKASSDVHNIMEELR